MQIFLGLPEMMLIIWVVVKIMVPFWIPSIIRHLVYRGPKKGDHNFDNHPYSWPMEQTPPESNRGIHRKAPVDCQDEGAQPTELRT